MAMRVAQQQGGQQARAVIGVEPEVKMKPGYIRPEESDVVAAVGSLYADRLRPFGRILLKRLRERSAAAATALAGAAGDADAAIGADAAPLIDPKALRQVCEACGRLEVQPEEGKEYSVLLRGRQEDFVEVSSPADPYPAEMWEQLAAYLEGSPIEEVALPGGRYACAQVLAGRHLPFLQGRTLGELCHIVQVALSHRRLLGYSEGRMVPHSRSLSCAKELCAVLQRPVAVTKKTSADLRIANVEEARACLWEILSSAGQPGVVPLSNVKRLFRSRYGLELSETAMGHSRLSELLQDASFGDLCRLEARGCSGQVVVQRMPYPHRTSVRGGLSDAALDAASASWPMAALEVVGAPPGLYSSGLGFDEAAAAVHPIAAAFVSAAPCQQHPAHAASGASASRAKASEPLSSGAGVLSHYVRQLLELSLDESRDALQSLSAQQWPAARTSSAAADGAGGSSDGESPGSGKFGGTPCVSLSRSTSEGSAAQSDDDGLEADWASSPVSAAPKTLRPPPGLPPPPGLAAF